MNTSITRKISFSILLTLVLALGVQGIADALTFGNHSSSDGDLRTVYQNQEFTIRVPVSLKSPERKSGWKNTPTTDATDTAVIITDANRYYNDANNDGEFQTSETTGDYNDAHNYDQEQITIVVDGNANIKKVGSHNVPNSRAQDLTMYERSHDTYDTAANDERFSGSITLTLEPTSVGTIVVRVTDSTIAIDNRGGAVSGLRMVYTVYVVNYKDTPATALGFATTTIAGTGNYAVGRDDNHDSPIQITVTPTTNTPITLEVVDGPGQLYVEKTYSGEDAAAPKSKGTSSRLLETSSNAAVATGGDTGADVYLDMRGGTNRVTISAPGTTAPPVTAIFVYGYPTMQIVSDNPQGGVTGGRLAEPLVVRVRDGKTRGIPMAIVTFSSGNAMDTNERFLPVPGTTVHVDTTDNWADSYSDIEDINDPVTATSIYPMTDDATPTDVDDNVVVQTDRSGDAKVYFQLGSMEERQNVTAAAMGANAVTFRATATTVVSGDASTITIVDGDGQRAAVDEPLDDPLIVLVKDSGGRLVAGTAVTFTTNSGELSAPEPGDPGEEKDDTPEDVPKHTAFFIIVNTDDTGQASVRYNVGDLPGAKQVFARIDISNGRTRTKTFNVNGRAVSTTRPDPVDNTPTVTQVSVPSSVTGTAGGTTTLRVTAATTAQVETGRLGDTFPSVNVGSFTRSGTTHTSTLTLPSTADTYMLTVFVGNTSYPVSVRVTAAPVETGGTLSVRVDPFSGVPGTTATVTVTATDSDDEPANVTVRVSATGGTLSVSSVATGTDGRAAVTLTRGSTAGTENYVTVSATDYDSAQSRYIISGAAPPAPGDTPTPRETTGEAGAIDIYDGNQQSGSLNTPLRDPFIVEVVDANDNPVENVRVRFRVAQGSGRLSPRTPRTDEDGFAATRFTPTSSGRIRVEATVADVDDIVRFTVQGGDPADALVKVSGDTQTGTPEKALAKPFIVEVQDEDGEPLAGHRVSFEVTAGGGSLSETSATTGRNGRAQTTLTLGSAPGINSVRASVTGADAVTFSTSVDAKILVAAANRPVMYWIAGGALYRLAGAKEAKIADKVKGVAVGGGKVYWTSQTGPSAGTINAANLDGSNPETLTTIRAVPMGITVDTAGSQLYWTNSRGRIQSATLNGSGIRNVVQNLSDPTDIVVSNGFIYWTAGGNTIKRVNLKGQKTVQDVAANLDTVGGIAVGSGKVYWTEATGEGAGTVNGANLNGTNFETLATLLSAPMGIAVDTAGSKLYWTNARGRVQSANLDGSAIRNVVDGLMAPGKLAIGDPNAATATPTATAKTPTTKQDNSQYDVNGDGKVDNVDASLVASGLDTGNAKYDVNKDGAVNFLDLLLIFENRDADAAGAPTIVGMQLSALQRDRLQTQIDLLIATNDRSPAAMRTLVYLQQLLVMARPEKTQLLANYPNPFNPETWMPYELATDTNVKVTIYNAQGVVIRTLQLGQQSAGYYTDRERAAYWDGRNAFGEQVASGVYFYQLETDELSSLRKMVILK